MKIPKCAIRRKRKIVPKFDLFDWAELQNIIRQPLHIKKLVVRLGLSPALAGTVAELAGIKGALHV